MQKDITDSSNKQEIPTTSSISRDARSIIKYQAQFAKDYIKRLSQIPTDAYPKLKALQKRDPQLFEKLERIFDTKHDFILSDKDIGYISLYLRFCEKNQPENVKITEIVRRFFSPHVSEILQGLADTKYNHKDRQFIARYITLNLEIPPHIARALRSLRDADPPLFEQLENQWKQTKTTPSTGEQFVSGFIECVGQFNPDLARRLQIRFEKDQSQAPNDGAQETQKECTRSTSAFKEISFGAWTQEKKGKAGRTNQDAHFTDREHRVFAVFDGVGKHENSHLASGRAKDIIAENVHFLSDGRDLENIKMNIKGILVEMHQKIVSNREGTTTASIVKIMADGTVIIGHVGDCRVYLLRAEEEEESLIHLTHDHGLACTEEYEKEWGQQKAIANLETFDNVSLEHKSIIEKRHKLMTSLGNSSRKPDITIYERKLIPGKDIGLVLMTDGIYDNLPDVAIDTLFRELPNCEEAAKYTVKLAEEAMDAHDKTKRKKQRSKPDDATAIVIRFGFRGNEITIG